MAMRRRGVPPENDDDEHPWRELLGFLLLVGFMMLLYFLGRSMVQHHFFTGGALNNHQGHSVGP